MTHKVAAYSCKKNKQSFNNQYLCYLFQGKNTYKDIYNAVQDCGTQWPRNMGAALN